MFVNPLSLQQYNNAYPAIPYNQPPCATNGYGWHGNGYGWQLDPQEWRTVPLYPSLEGLDHPDAASNDVQPVEEPPILQNKLSDQQSIFFGQTGSGTRSNSGVEQDFYKLRDYHLQQGSLFEDPDFEPSNYSLFGTNRPDGRFVWKRPHEIVDDPHLFVEGFSRFDVQQGKLGDCWLLAAVANLTLFKRLFFQVVPEDQSFSENYAGIFHFRFWQYGKWVDVCVDDRLPTEDDELVYLHSTEKNEFWSALLEKAYAKLHGSYEALKGGSTCEAMEDFTGGVTEMYELENPPPNLFQILVKAYERSSLMGCSLEPDPSQFEAQTSEGLIRGHAYSITSVKYVHIQTPNVSGKIALLRLRNPWGNEYEWNGAWSDGSPEWRYIDEDIKNSLGLNFDDDGEFWMSFKDFETHFDRIEICNLNPDSLTDDELRGKKKWSVSNFEGSWTKGLSAGGCRNFLDTFWKNPQYRVTLEQPDDGEDRCTMIVALMQKNRRIMKVRTGDELLTVGFAIYYLPNSDRLPKPLDSSFFKYNASVARSPSFINLREVSCRFKLPQGTYCIIPSTYDPNEEGDFMLRIFTENSSNMEYGGVSYPISNRIDYNDEKEDNSAGYGRTSNYTFGGHSSFPHHSFPHFPSSDNSFAQPSSPQPYHSSGGYPQQGYPSSPSYPNSGYPPNPYSYSQYPSQTLYPSQPHYPGQSQYPSHPQYPTQPQYPSSRRDSDDDLKPITSLFKRLFR